jgi:hypothetical protein
MNAALSIERWSIQSRVAAVPQVFKQEKPVDRREDGAESE